MKTGRIALLMSAILCLTPVFASAQPGGNGPPGRNWNNGGGRGYQQPPGPPPGRGGYNRRAPMPPPRFAGPVWRPGNRYYGGDPWVNDWQGRPGLYAPPPGYRWVNTGNQFLLTAIATGIISAVVAGSIANGGMR